MISKYLIQHDKTYIATLKFGEKRDTGDSEGKTINEDISFKISNFSEEQIDKKLQSFIGKNMQIPPMYSAIKLNGKKLYEYARSGEKIEVQPREIEIYEMELKKVDYSENEIQFLVSCSKGTYIRTLCEDIACRFETVGYMKELNRTRVGLFKLEDSIEIEDLENNTQDVLNKRFITIEKFFDNKDKIILDSRKKELFLNGVKLTQKRPDDIYRIYSEDNKFIRIRRNQTKFIKKRCYYLKIQLPRITFI